MGEIILKTSDLENADFWGRYLRAVDKKPSTPLPSDEMGNEVVNYIREQTLHRDGLIGD